MRSTKEIFIINAVGIGLKLCIFSIMFFPLLLCREASAQPGKTKLLVVSSYHKEYNWSRDTNEGFCAAMLQLGYFDSKDQTVQYTADDFIETSRAIIKKLWLDAKRKDRKDDLARATRQIISLAKEFEPDLVFLGDDDAAQYVGSQLLDRKIPVVFWGIDNTPVKYGLVDSEEKPGHNVTGVFQSGYSVDSLNLLKKIAPATKSFAILSDESTTGRARVKMVEYLARKGLLPLEQREIVATNGFEEWKLAVLALQDKVDAFYMVMWSSLKDKEGKYVPADEVARWYLTNIKKPEATTGGHFVRQGLLCAADDAGYNQGFEAVLIAHDILAKGANPATYPPRTPKRGKLIVNRQRATMLGITITPEMGVEKVEEDASVLTDKTP